MSNKPIAVVLHSWGNQPNKDWYPFVRKELEMAGWQVFIPAMPNTQEPKIQAWVDHLRHIVKTVDTNTLFIGHSVGCQTILRFLETQEPKTKSMGAIFVAGWFDLQGLESEQEQQIAKPWLETPINFARIKPMLPKVHALFSDNDPYVDPKNSKEFSKHLAANIHMYKNKGHFTADDGCQTLPDVVKIAMQIKG